MLSKLCWPSFAIILLWLLSQVAAEELYTTVLGKSEHGSLLHVDEKTMVECGGHIKQCGIMEDMRIILSPISTVYVTQNFTTTTEKVLPTQTVVKKKVKVVTVNNQTHGHCRKTTIVPDLKPAIITVNVTVEHVQEIVPITTVTSTEISIVTATSIEQCFINNPEPSFYPTISTSQDPSSAIPPSSQVPSSAALSSQDPLSSEEPQARGTAITDGQGETESSRYERIYQDVDDVSENPGMNIQGE
ncbi:uncharacterized protein FIESC28_03452 [Fusarium coffeatum]|uniref:Uncharacterized protein n=1 Tax=Fusarium coffeatum TaxID=231269 RepID=A0A366S349_9HYPO|nr:uncharacterized protein FIESC28_03452 [Fusarium coffeatum]RBR23747.1 hypothetical protein FIESC28_03452 [Fusarium coffeatum]